MTQGFLAQSPEPEAHEKVLDKVFSRHDHRRSLQ